MSYLSLKELKKLGFKSLGKNVKISSLASIYDCEKMEIGDNSRIDDFCILSGKIQMGSNVHVTPMCLIAGGSKGVYIDDFVTLAYGVKVFSQSDDYSGETMTNSTVPKKYKNEYKKETYINSFSIIGANSVIMPGVTVASGTAVGAMSLILKSTNPWGIYVGSPARRIKERSSNLLSVYKQLLKNS